MSDKYYEAQKSKGEPVKYRGRVFTHNTYHEEEELYVGPWRDNEFSAIDDAADFIDDNNIDAQML